MESSWIITARGANAKTVVGDESGNVEVEEYVKADAGAGAGGGIVPLRDGEWLEFVCAWCSFSELIVHSCNVHSIEAGQLHEGFFKIIGVD